MSASRPPPSQLLLLMSHGMGYPFGQHGSAVLAVSQVLAHLQAAGEGECWEDSPDAVPALLGALGSYQQLLATKTKLSTVGKINSISGRPKTARNATSF